jgi:hypothetical protein
MVEKFRLTNAKPVSTPMDPGSQFSINQCPTSLNQIARMRGVPYSEAIRSALWPIVMSRPDAVFAIGVLSQFIQNLGPAHWEGLKCVINYLGCTKNLWLTFRGKKNTLVEGFCNLDQASQKDQHSISGYLFYFGMGAITLEFKEAKYHCVIQHGGRVHCTDTCS